jgi:hypothetical protein
MLVLQGVGTMVIVGLIGGHLPAWLEGAGLTADIAGRYSYWIVALFGVTGLTASLFMRRVPGSAGREISLIVTLGEFIRNLRAVLGAARRNRRFAVVLLMGFAARSDSQIVLAFLSLWIVRAAGDRGVDPAVALKTAGYMIFIFQGALAITPMFFGFVVDRVNRTTLLIGSCALAGLAFTATALITDVFSVWTYIVVGLVGVTETALIVSIQSVMGEEAPPALRGSSMGVFAFLGSISVVLISFSGRFLFDSLGYVAPFVLVGLLNVLFAAIGFVAVAGGASLRARRA